jgi:hypothetical protein
MENWGMRVFFVLKVALMISLSGRADNWPRERIFAHRYIPVTSPKGNRGSSKPRDRPHVVWEYYDHEVGGINNRWIITEPALQAGGPTYISTKVSSNSLNIKRISNDSNQVSQPWCAIRFWFNIETEFSRSAK